MSDNNTTIVAELAKTTTNYAVYESAEVAGSQDLTGMYVSLATFGEGNDPLGFIEVEVAEEGPVSLAKNKDTKSFGVYESASGAISGMYVSHDVLGSEEGEDGFEAPEERGISISPATEEDFEESQESEELQEEASSLLSDAGDSDAVEAESTDEAEEESDEEAEAEALLAEAEDAA